MAGCPASDREDGGLYYLGEDFDADPDWRDMVEGLLALRSDYGCEIARWAGFFSRNYGKGLETLLELTFVMNTCVSAGRSAEDAHLAAIEFALERYG